MFTGLIEAKGRVTACDEVEVGVEFAFQVPFAKELEMGESVAVNGVCLTVASYSDDGFTAVAIPETLANTTLADFVIDRPVNLERALKIGARLGGHFVQGHVDAVGSVVAWDERKKGVVLTIAPPAALLPFIAQKGSITIDGVSLTVSARGDDAFSVSLVPHTLKETTLGGLKAGDHVNLEVDVIARYLAQLNA